MTISVGNKELVDSQVFLTTDDSFSLKVRPESSNEITIFVNIKEDLKEKYNTLITNPISPEEMEMNFINSNKEGTGIGPHKIGTIGNSDMVIYIWFSTLSNSLRRVEYSMFKETNLGQ